MAKQATNDTVQALGWRWAGWLAIGTGSSLFLASPWWARSVVEGFEALPGGAWWSVSIPFVPLLLVLLGTVALVRRA